MSGCWPSIVSASSTSSVKSGIAMPATTCEAPKRLNDLNISPYKYDADSGAIAQTMYCRTVIDSRYLGYNRAASGAAANTKTESSNESANAARKPRRAQLRTRPQACIAASAAVRRSNELSRPNRATTEPIVITVSAR